MVTVQQSKRLRLTAWRHPTNNGTQSSLTRSLTTVESIAARTPWDASSSLDVLLSGVLRDVPAMPTASCRGHHDVFDLAAAGDVDAQRQAVAICRGCADRGRCRDWATTLTATERRAMGVVGGQCFAPVKTAKSVAQTGGQCPGSGKRNTWPDAEAETGIATGSDPRCATNDTALVQSHGRQQRQTQRARIERLRAERRARRTASKVAS